MADRDVLEIRMDVAARPSTVFRFLSQPERFQEWMGAGCTADLRVGGEVIVRYPGGETARGTVTELVPDRRLVFTWGYDGGAGGLEPGASRVAIELTPTAGGTSVVLRHSGLATDERRREHRAGWTYRLSALSARTSADQVAGQADRAVDQYLAAWATTDGEPRAELLRSSCEEEVEFRDSMGHVRGRVGLDEYIANAQRFVPGVKLERAGPVLRSHYSVSYPWRMVGPEGKPMMAGQNYGELSPDGRFRLVVGFWG